MKASLKPLLILLPPALQPLDPYTSSAPQLLHHYLTTRDIKELGTLLAASTPIPNQGSIFGATERLHPTPVA